ALPICSDPNTFTATLNGHNEVPVVHTKGTGSLTLTVDPVAKTMTFTLTYSGLNNPAMAAHVHLGQPNVNGGVVFFFCGGPTTGPPPKPACPAGTTTPATVTGTVNAGDILAPMNQGLTAGAFDGIVEEM